MSDSQYIPANCGASVLLLTTAIVFAAYARTASQSIAGGDSGELVAEGCKLGTSHPPGYPLYTIIVYFVVTLGKRFFPALTPAYLVNIASCAFGSFSSGLISLIVYELTNTESDGSDFKPDAMIIRCSAAVSAGLMCAFSPLMWQYNTSAEVFALNNLFVSLILYAFVVYIRRPSSTFIVCAGAFVCGLALTNQHTCILLILPITAWVICNSALLKKPKMLLASASSFAAGIGLYAALPYLAMKYPHAGSWGDVTSLSGFVNHFLRRDYGTLRLYSGSDATSEDAVARTASWAQDFVSKQLGLPSSLLIFPALALSFGRKSSRTKGKKRTRGRCSSHAPTENPSSTPSTVCWKMVLSALVFYLGVFHSLSNLPLSNPLLYGIHQRFWMHPNIFCFLLIGVASHSAIRIATSNSSWIARNVLVVLVLMMPPLVMYHQNYNVSDQSDNQLFRKYAMSILETLPGNSLLLSNYDQQWTSIRYLQECEGVRPDVTSINLSMMTFQWWKSKHSLYEGRVIFPGTHYTKGNTAPWLNGGFTFSEFIDANTEVLDSNIFIGGNLNFQDDSFVERYQEEPFGLVRKISPRSDKSGTAESYRLKSLAVWRSVAGHLSRDLPCEKKYPSSTWESTIKREFVDHMVSRSTYLLDLALKDESGKPSSEALQSIAEAAAWLEYASSLDEQLTRQSSMKKNLGLAYMNVVRSKESGALPFVEDLFGIGGAETPRDDDGPTSYWFANDDDVNWKEHATIRWREEWEAFLRLDSSKADPSYSQVKNIYEAVMQSSQAKK